MISVPACFRLLLPYVRRRLGPLKLHTRFGTYPKPQILQRQQPPFMGSYHLTDRFVIGVGALAQLLQLLPDLIFRLAHPPCQVVVGKLPHPCHNILDDVVINIQGPAKQNHLQVSYEIAKGVNSILS